MPPHANRAPFALFASAIAALAAAGCGGSPSQPAGPAPTAEKSIFSSAKDCAENSKLPMQKCSELVEAAIAEHMKSSPTYLSQRTCETTEGADRCERHNERSYRPRLIAFAFTITGEQATATPVYILNDGASTGFRNGKLTYLLTDDNLKVTKKSLAVYESLAGKPNG